MVIISHNILQTKTFPLTTNQCGEHLSAKWFHFEHLVDMAMAAASNKQMQGYRAQTRCLLPLNCHGSRRGSRNHDFLRILFSSSVDTCLPNFCLWSESRSFETRRLPSGAWADCSNRVWFLQSSVASKHYLHLATRCSSNTESVQGRASVLNHKIHMGVSTQ